MTITIYHNPNCGTSRNVLALIRNSGEEPEVIEYLKTPPSRERLKGLIAAMGISVRDLLRQKGTPYDELGLDDPKLTDDELIDLMLQHPILINRPIVESALGTRLCRPSEVVLEILPNPQRGEFRKEDGELIVNVQGTCASERESCTMSDHTYASTAEAIATPPAGIGFFEKWLSLWVALCIGAGLLLGNTLPGLFEALAHLEIASVNLVVAVLIWAMVYPMMVAVDFASLRHIGDRPKGLVLTIVVNWLIKPFTMAGLAVLFFEVLFADMISPADAQQYIAGLILLGAAPCTAMVFVWSQLTRGDPTYTLVQVSVNDVIMIFAFAPIVALLLGVTDIAVPWETLILSVGLYILIPLAAGAVTRRWLARGRRGENTEAAVARFTAAVKPFSVIGLLATVVLLFGFQGQIILEQPLLIALIAVPLLIQSYGIFALAYAGAWVWRVPFNVAAPCALIGTSNFFELAVAVAISLFGLQSGAALATVVGVLVEVPVMLSLVAFANRTRHHFPATEEPGRG